MPENQLHDAAYKGDVGSARELLAEHPEWASEKDEEGNTPLRWAATWGHIDIVLLLLDSFPAAVAMPNSNLDTPCDLALKYKDGDWQEVVALLVAAEGGVCSPHHAEWTRVKLPPHV